MSGKRKGQLLCFGPFWGGFRPSFRMELGKLLRLSGRDVSELSVPFVTSQRPGFQKCSELLKVAQVNEVKGELFFFLSLLTVSGLS